MADICVTKATAIAAVNAVLKHLKLGLFISEYGKIHDHGPIYWSKLETGKGRSHTYLTVEGITNTGYTFWASGIVEYKLRDTDSSDPFPITAVYVSVRNMKFEGRSHYEYDYYQCTFGAEDFQIRKVEEPEFRKLVKTD